GDGLAEIEILRELAVNAEAREDHTAHQRHLGDALAACERWDTDVTREIAADVRKRLAGA
ncbi:hypothetical protein ACR9EG_13235, partial [Lactococcus lactis]